MIDSIRWSRVLRCLGVATFVFSPAMARAQIGGAGDCGYETSGTLHGVVVNDRSGVPVPRSYIYLDLPGACRATADGLGRFVVRGVPPGTHRVYTGMSGFERFVPVQVTVETGGTTYVELRLVAGGALEDCRALAPCSVLLDSGSALPDSGDIGFRLAVLGTAIGLIWPLATAEGRWVACLEDEPEIVIEALGDLYGAVAAAESCAVGADASGVPGRRLLHTETRRPAFRLLVEAVIALSSNRRTVLLGYFVGSLDGAGWECDFLKTDRGWQATLCVEAWDS